MAGVKALFFSLVLALLCSLGAAMPAQNAGHGANGAVAVTAPSAAAAQAAAAPEDCEHLHAFQARGTHTPQGSSTSHACCGAAALPPGPWQLGLAPAAQSVLAALALAPELDVSYPIDKPPKRAATALR